MLSGVSSVTGQYFRAVRSVSWSELIPLSVKSSWVEYFNSMSWSTKVIPSVPSSVGITLQEFIRALKLLVTFESPLLRVSVLEVGRESALNPGLFQVFGAIVRPKTPRSLLEFLGENDWEFADNSFETLFGVEDFVRERGHG